jgi:hypothetical protein
MAYVIISDTTIGYNNILGGIEFRGLVTTEELYYLKLALKVKSTKYILKYYTKPEMVKNLIDCFGEKSIINTTYTKYNPLNELLTIFYKHYFPKILRKIHPKNFFLKIEKDILKIEVEHNKNYIGPESYKYCESQICDLLDCDTRISKLKTLKIIPEIANIIEDYIIYYTKGHHYKFPISDKEYMTLTLEDEIYISEEEYSINDLMQEYPQVKKLLAPFIAINNLSEDSIVYMHISNK